MRFVYPPVMNKLLFLCLGAGGLVSAGCGILSPGSALNAEESRGGNGGNVGLTQVVGRLKHGGEICFENLPLTSGKGECRGGVRNKATAKVALFSGTCDLTMPQEKAKVGDDVAISCKLSNGKSCFSGAGIVSSTAISSTVESIDDGRKWITKENEAGKGEIQFVIGSSCSEVFGLGAPNPNPKPELPECKEETGGSLHLAAEVPPPSECLGVAGPARMNCFLQKNAAEVYDYSVPGDVARIRAGERSPDRCYVNFPDATRTSKHLFVYRTSGGGYKGAIGTGDVGVGNSPNSLTYGLTRLQELDPPYYAVASRSSDYLTAAAGSEPDANGYWLMGGLRVVRFVPKTWCADKYLFRSVDLNQLQSIQLGAAPPPAPPATGTGDQVPQPDQDGGSTEPQCKPKAKN